MDRPKEICFMGGSLTIQPGGTYKKDGVDTPFNAKVKTSGIVDKYGNAKPSVFLSMVKAVSGDAEAIKLLERIS